ncbi:MAG: hypothetical protein U0892_16755 [Pirellulales bacterium]
MQQDQQLQQQAAQQRKNQRNQTVERLLGQMRQAEQNSVTEERAELAHRDQLRLQFQQHHAEQLRNLRQSAGETRQNQFHLTEASRQRLRKIQRSIEELLRPDDEEAGDSAGDSNNEPQAIAIAHNQVKSAVQASPQSLSAGDNSVADSSDSGGSVLIASHGGGTPSTKVFLDAIEQARKIKKKTDRVTLPVEQAAKGLGQAMKNDPIVSDNQLVNDIRDWARKSNRDNSRFTSLTAESWVIESGLFELAFKEQKSPLAAANLAIQRLEAEQSRFHKLATACDALEVTTKAINLADDLHVKGWAKRVISTSEFDKEARKETILELQRCRTDALHAEQELKRAVQILQGNRDNMRRSDSAIETP